MNRRGLLRALGSGAAAVAVAGCLGGEPIGSPTPSATPEESPADSGTPTATETHWFDPAGTVETVRIGTNPGEINPHEATIWNAASSSRTVGIQVRDADAGEILHEKTYEFPADMALTISFRESASYRVYLAVEETDTEPTFRVSSDRIDTCNDSSTHVRLESDGTLWVWPMTTERQCGTATETPTGTATPSGTPTPTGTPTSTLTPTATPAENGGD